MLNEDNNPTKIWIKDEKDETETKFGNNNNIEGSLINFINKN